MLRPLLEMRYHETYYHANVIQNLMSDPVSYIRHLDEFFGDVGYQRFVHPFPKFSALHDFIDFSMNKLTYEEVQSACSTIEPKSLACHVFATNRVLAAHNTKHKSFAEWILEEQIEDEDVSEDEAWEYHSYLNNGPYLELKELLIEEVFYVLFLNRRVLERFNKMAAEAIESGNDRRLRRVHIPEWVKKAVYHRDRGHCSNCNVDLTGVISIGASEHYDHIVPLNAFGINDVTNIQLLCQHCNTSKGSKHRGTSDLYQKWY